MKKIALVGLIYDTNLGDPAIYESTKKIVTDYPGITACIAR